MSSISSSSTSSGSSTSGGNVQNTATVANLSFDSASCDSPKAFHRSGTLNSQCSVESGIIADISLGVDERPESPKATHWPLEKSNSRHSSSSDGTATTTPTQSDDTQVTTIYIVPDDLPVNI
ncbi:uncharacterized protein LOC112905388 [Agrilus planipennis]|nr:uncharacterized protein LOC112905388 [Agrilus planipennis]